MDPEGAQEVVGSRQTFTLSRTDLALSPEPEGARKVVGSIQAFTLFRIELALLQEPPTDLMGS
jgi:hypothetical protein